MGLWPFKRSKQEERADDDDEVHPAEEPPTGVAAWWFAREARRAGSVERFDDAPEVGRAGLHAADTPLSALEHAKSDFLCRVVLDGEIAEMGSQRAATYRRVTWCVDANEALRPPVQAWIERVLGAPLEGIGHHRAAAGDARESVVDAAARVRDARWKLDEGAARKDENARARAEGELAGAERRAAEARASAEAHEAAAALLEGRSIDQLARAVDHVVAAYAAFEAGDRDAALDRTRVRLGAELAEALENVETVSPESVIPSEPPEPEPPPPFATPTEGTACERLVEILRSDVALVGAHPMRPIPGAPGPFALVLRRLDDGRDEELLGVLNGDRAIATAGMSFVVRVTRDDGEPRLRFSERCIDAQRELLDALILDATKRPVIPLRGLLDLRACLASHPQVESAAWSKRARRDERDELAVWFRGDSDAALVEDLSAIVDADIAVLGPHWDGLVRIHRQGGVETQHETRHIRLAIEHAPFYRWEDGLPRGRRRRDRPGAEPYRRPAQARIDPLEPLRSLGDVLMDVGYVQSVHHVTFDTVAPPRALAGRPVVVVWTQPAHALLVRDRLARWLADHSWSVGFAVRSRSEADPREYDQQMFAGWRPEQPFDAILDELDHSLEPLELGRGERRLAGGAQRFCALLAAAAMKVAAVGFAAAKGRPPVLVVHVADHTHALAVTSELEDLFPALPIVALIPPSGDASSGFLANRSAQWAIGRSVDRFWIRAQGILNDGFVEPRPFPYPSFLHERGPVRCPRCRVSYDLACLDSPIACICAFCGHAGLEGRPRDVINPGARPARCPACDARFVTQLGYLHARCPTCAQAVEPVFQDTQ